MIIHCGPGNIAGVCGAGLYGGQPSPGVCRRCYEFKSEEPDTRPLKREVAITPTPADPATWPRLARWVSKLARPADRGVGDTVAWLISPLGAQQIAGRWPRLAGIAGRVIVRLLGADMDAAYVRITGGACQTCGARQVGLNSRYPYPRVG